ncbi:MAG: peptidoglycan DD-metalloendopeptidase family protein [Pseudanabaenaceae cyanobacterium]|jgi:murein DD-endopeptidase MepM/ murein hydrolase activator NlpD
MARSPLLVSRSGWLSICLGIMVAGLAEPLTTKASWANRLETFVYDIRQNQISFSLEKDLDPRGVVLQNPTRIVIDLPGMVYKGPTVRRRVGRGVQAVRVGQVDQETTRMVVELSPDAELDPSQLKLKSDKPGRWSMDLPKSIAALDLNSVANFLMPATGPITSGFGWRVHPITGEQRLHKGIDIGAAMGAPILAASDGVVTEAGWTDGGYGNIVELKHPDGTLTLYAHTSRVLVSKGDTVKRGDVIAEVGSTGRSTGPHLHFEVQPDGKTAVDPMDFIAANHVVLDLAANHFKD